jgi:hypothetical protein
LQPSGIWLLWHYPRRRPIFLYASNNIDDVSDFFPTWPASLLTIHQCRLRRSPEPLPRRGHRCETRSICFWFHLGCLGLHDHCNRFSIHGMRC